MQLSNNPLASYFRTVAIYLDLPSNGQNYPEGVIEPTETGKLPVYPMTSIDELNIRNPDGLFTGEAVVGVIRSCVPNIKDPWKLQSIDLDSVLVAIKIATNGDKMEVETSCPKCEEMTKFDVNLVNVLSTIKVGNYNDELKVNDLYFKFKPLAYKMMQEISVAQFQFQKAYYEINDESNTMPIEEKTKISKDILKQINDLTMKSLAQSIEYVKTPSSFVDNQNYILDFLKNCDKNTYVKLRDHNIALKEKSDIKPLDIKCPSCEHEYKNQFTVNFADFF